MWYLPGGGLDFGEHPRVGALRKLREETGYIGELDALLGVEVLRLADPDGIAWELVWIIYRARVTGGKLTPEADGSTDFAAWVNPERLTTVNTGQLVERALALPLHGGSPVPPYDGLAATGRSELRGVTRLVARGTAAATDESARRVAHGSTVRPGGRTPDHGATRMRAWMHISGGWPRTGGWSASAATSRDGPRRQKPFALSAVLALRVLHRRIRPREHERFLSVITADEVRRRSVSSSNLDDLRALVGRTDDPAVHVQPVPHCCAHGNSSHGCSLAASTFLVGSGRELRT